MTKAAQVRSPSSRLKGLETPFTGTDARGSCERLLVKATCPVTGKRSFFLPPGRRMTATQRKSPKHFPVCCRSLVRDRWKMTSHRLPRRSRGGVCVPSDGINGSYLPCLEAIASIHLPAPSTRFRQFSATARPKAFGWASSALPAVTHSMRGDTTLFRKK